MYNYQLLKGEEVILISDNSILKIDNDSKNVSTIVTNKRLILLDYPSALNNNEEDLRIARGLQYIKQKEEIFSVSLDKIKEIKKANSFVKYILNDSNYFYLKDDDVEKTIGKNIK